MEELFLSSTSVCSALKMFTLMCYIKLFTYLVTVTVLNKKALLSQRGPCDARCPEKFRESSQTPLATFPKICKGLLFPSILRMCIQNLKFVALSVPEIIGGTQKFGQSLYTPTLQFLPNF